MTVLHVISSGGMYGAEAVILQVSAEMNRAGRDRSVVAVFSHAGQPEPALYRAALTAGVPVAQIPCKGQVDLSVAGTLRSLAQRLEADVVHAHGYKADIYTYFAFRGRTAPALVSTCHTWYDNDVAVRLYGAVDRWVLRHFDQVVAVSADVSSRLLQAGVAPTRVQIIRNGVALPSKPDRSTNLIATRLPAKVRVGLVGRLAPEKGVDVFVRAVARLKQAHPNAHFVIAGDGPDRESLQSLIAGLGLQGRVELLGRQEDMAAFYGSLDLLVSASRHEGLPMALLEGMSAGLPVVATTVGEVPRVVMDAVTGYLVPPDAPAALADAMDQMLRQPEQGQRFGAAGRQRIHDEFSATRMTSEYLAVYQKALVRHLAMPAGAQSVSGTR